MPIVKSEDLGFMLGTPPIDINGAGAVGDTVSMRGAAHCIIVIQCGVLGAATPAVTLKQSTVVAETDAKALGFSWMWTNAADTTSSILVKTAVTSNTFNIAATADGGMYIIDVPADTLDVDNGFDCLECRVADPSASQLVSILYILSGTRFENVSDLDTMID